MSGKANLDGTDQSLVDFANTAVKMNEASNLIDPVSNIKGAPVW